MDKHEQELIQAIGIFGVVKNFEILFPKEFQNNKEADEIIINLKTKTIEFK